jgi:hypothetical protein
MPSLRMLSAAGLVCAVCLCVISVTGCSSIVPPEVSAMTKIATGQMNTLTGAEIQALTSSPIIAAYVPDLQLTDPQAAAIAQFLADNNVAAIADLQALIARAIADPTSIVLPDGFLALFQDFKLPTTQQPQ